MKIALSRRAKWMATMVAVFALAVSGVATWWFVLRGNSEPLNVRLYEMPEFQEYELVASRGKLKLWSLSRLLDIRRDDGGGPIEVACAADVTAEIRALEAAGFRPNDVKRDLKYLTLSPQPVTFLVFAKNHAIVESETSSPLQFRGNLDARRDHVDLITGFADYEVQTTPEFAKCLRGSVSSDHSYTWRSNFLIGALAIVGVNAAAIDAQSSLMAQDIRVDLASLSLRYFQFGESKGLRIRDVLSELNSDAPDPAAAAEAFRSKVTGYAIIGTRISSIAP